jgi:hypothetical protein
MAAPDMVAQVVSIFIAKNSLKKEAPMAEMEEEEGISFSREIPRCGRYFT